MTRPCPRCTSTNTKPYTAKPPRKHDGACTPECEVTGSLCLNCRLYSPGPC